MALTYQPFADAPELDEVGAEARRNVSDQERNVSAGIGIALALAGLARGGVLRWPLVLAGGAMLNRAITGHCSVYRHFAIDTRHPRAGVRNGGGKRIEAAVIIRRSPEDLFRFWLNLEALPRVMRHVKSVRDLGGKRSHWEVHGPAGTTLKWDAEIINLEDNRLIAWQSLPEAAVANAGSVWFEPAGDGQTRLKVALAYAPPAGALGAALAALWGASSEANLAEDLNQFKHFAETVLHA